MTGWLPSVNSTEFFDFANESEPWFRNRLKELVEHRTVSPGGQNFEDIREGAKAAARLIKECGAEVELVESAGTPSILGRFTHPNPRTRILVYNHLDVQPADPIGWNQSDPFQFEVQKDDEREFLYLGRGTTDDKGPALCSLRAASQIAAKELPIEIVLLWETEEEIGSPHFPEVLRAKEEILRADAAVVSDTIWPSGNQPAIPSGLRGGVTASLHLETGKKDVHSGLVGGVARNPLRELSKIVTAIEGATFCHRNVASLSTSEIDGFLQSGFDPEHFRNAYDLVHSKALETGFGKSPAIVREGGSIGAVPQMQEILGLPVHFLPLSLPEHGYHAPNERFDWKQARGGIVAFCQLFSDLASNR